MTTMRLGKAGDDGPEGRVAQPLGDPAAKNAIAQGALAGDHHHGAPVFRPAAQDESGENLSRLILIEAVQVDDSRR